MKLFLALAGLLVVGLVFYRIRDVRYLKKRTREALSPALSEEIAKERETNLEKRRKFAEAMKKYGNE